MTIPTAYRNGTSNPPSLSTKAMADLTAVYSNRLEAHPADFRRHLISASLAPTGTERAALDARRAELRASLVPTPGSAARDVILALVAGFASYGMGERETSVKVAMYAEALRDQPTWAIERARRTFATGGWVCDWNGAGTPSSAQVRAECLNICLPIEAELHKLGSILDAELVDTDTTEDERQKALAHWQQLRAGIARSNVLSERTPEEVARERSEMERANKRVGERCGLEAGAMTDELRATLADIRALHEAAV